MTALPTLALLLTAAPAADRPAEVTIAVEKGHIDFRCGPELSARYVTDPKQAKPFFWPLHAPGGLTVTRSWPMEDAGSDEMKDHVHQKSAWFCHGDVIPEGVELKQKIKGVEGVDFWSEAKGHGDMVCTRVDEPQVGKDRATVKTHNEWRSADGAKLLDEERTIHFYDLGPARLLVVDIDLTAAVPVKFGDTKEGSFGVRINDQITALKGKGKIQNAEGIVARDLKSEVQNECWGKISAWCDYSGPIDGKEAGLAILADPKNAQLSCWHVRGYGLMAANPFGRARAAFPAVQGRKDLVQLAKGEHLRLRYGILLHTGDAETGRVAEHYQRFVQLRDKD
jgi:hypothetical protein